MEQKLQPEMFLVCGSDTLYAGSPICGPDTPDTSSMGQVRVRDLRFVVCGQVFDDG